MPDECNMPMRLLYASVRPQMPFEVHKWPPGDWYGPSHNPRHAQKPQYVAITYTWGRWRLDHGARPDVPGVAITGTEWTIPRVKPECFSEQGLREIIRSACEYSMGAQ